MRTLIIVQSNTGHGHISRANALGEHLEDKLVLSRPFSGKSKSKDFFDNQINDLFLQYKQYEPDVIITESYPFSRYGWDPHWNQNLKHNGILDILNHAKEKNKRIYALDRDIPCIQPKKEMYHCIDRLNEYYNGIFFAGDHKFINALSQLHQRELVNCEIHNTGYVTYPYKRPSVDKRNGILVSGGDWYELTHYYQRLFLTVKEKMMSQKISFIVGPQTPKDIIKKANSVGINLIERPSVNEFRNYLSIHKIAFTMLGYMTFTDLNITKTPALVTPNEKTSSEIYDANSNIIGIEESYRAEIYSKMGGCHWISNNDLNIDSILEGIEKTIKIKENDIPDINLNGGTYIMKEICNV
tara:strand:- start:3107 stop:4171 length:1065 start_codon:yes stop_codon:yes gene_type:complete